MLSLQCVYRLLSIGYDGDANIGFLLKTRTDSHFFYAPPNVVQTGCRCEVVRHGKTGLKSRFIALLL